jgi:hypothetical protein
MADQIVLEWTVDVAGTTFGPAEAAAALGAVPLYVDPVTDPVLGQLFGLTVAADVTSIGATTATRTLKLNMTGVLAPEAPPPFPCRPKTATPPVLPYPLRESVPLHGFFTVVTGATNVPTSQTQIATLSVGAVVQFVSQPGVFYTVAAVNPTSIDLSTPYTGVTGTTEAIEEVPAPVAIAAIYSTSPLDTNGVATVPPILPGPGAREVELTYFDSTGAGPFTVEVELTGKRPASVTLAVGSIDIAVIVNIVVSDTGSFENSVGQLTLVELSSTLPLIPPDATPEDFKHLTDEAQLLINRHLAYLPPSYFALSQQGSSFPQLEGDFLVTTGSPHVITTVDQSAVLAPGHVIQFAEQMQLRMMHKTVDVFYVVEAVSPRYLKLTTPYTGLQTNNPTVVSDGKEPIGAPVREKPSAAFLIDPSPASPPTEDQLSVTMGQFVEPTTALPPPTPPAPPATIPTPTFLSNIFTQTLQLALAVPVQPQPITFI